MKTRSMNSTNRSLISLSLLAALLMSGAIGCGRESKVYSDPAPTVDTTTSTDGRSVLPDDFFDQSVNLARVDVALDGDATKTIALRMMTMAGTSSAGSFNGSGIGSRALLGISSFNSKKLSEIDGVTFDSKTFVGTESPSVLLLVDPMCDGTSFRIFVADSTSLGAGTAVTAGYTRKDAAFSQAVWKISGAAFTSPTDSSVTLIPSTSGGTASSLTAFLSAYPSACLRNTTSRDADLPNGFPTAGVLLALGSSSTTTLNGVFINRVTVGSEVFAEME